MKSIDELQVFYQQTLLADLQHLEEKRKDILKKTIIGVLISIALVLAAGLIFASPEAIAIAAVIGVVAVIIIAGASWNTFRHEFKDRIIGRLVKFIDPSLGYNKDGMIQRKDFEVSGLFRQNISRYKGEDLITGKIDKTELSFSEIHAEYRTKDSKGRTQYHTIFKGLFFIADFHKDFQSRTFVLPDNAEKTLGSFGRFFQKMNVGMPPLQHMDDPEFEKEFAVYADDAVEARYILSTSMMQRMTDFKRRTKEKIHISFIHSKMFIAISYYRNLLEPSLFKQVEDFSSILSYFEELQMGIGLVEEFNLNTRVWSKQ